MVKNRQLIFIHIPKTAGSALKASISEIFDPHEIYFDYSKPLSKAPVLRKVECIGSSIVSQESRKVIYGHFLAGKYGDFSGWQFRRRRNCSYITFLRDPLQRAISHYYFWQRTEDSHHRVWRKMMKENWSLERFLLSTEHQNFMSQFFWRFPITNFDFVGLAEYFEQSVEILTCLVPELRELRVSISNTNPNKQITEKYEVDAELKKAFIVNNAKDYLLYRAAEAKFVKQKAQFEKGET